MKIWAGRFHCRAVILVLLVCLLTACAGNGAGMEGGEEPEDHALTIGMCFDSFIIERWEKDRDVFVSACRELGARVNVQNANGEVKEQIAQIEYFIGKGVDAIVIVPIDADALDEVVKKAKSRGIIVVAYDRMINYSNVDLYVSFNNEMVGTLMAEALSRQKLEKKQVIMLQGSPTDPNVAAVQKGFRSVMDGKGIEIIDYMYADGWRAEDAAEYLYAHPELLEQTDAIMCGNDNIATAVVRVLSEKRKAGDILVVGQDADLEACQRIVEGTQTMSVYKPVEKEAEEAARATVLLARQEKPDGLVNISDGKYGIPSIILEPVEVNADNMDELIISSGFHLREEVYMNIAQ